MIIRPIYAIFFLVSTFAGNIVTLANGSGPDVFEVNLSGESFGDELFIDDGSLHIFVPELQNNDELSGPRKYLERKAQRLPHKNFWLQAQDSTKDKLEEIGQKIFGPKAEPIFNYVLEVIFDVPLLIVLSILIFAFVFNVIIVVIIVFVSNLVKNTREKYKAVLRERYEQIVTNYIFEEIDALEAIEKMEKVKTSLGRKTLIEILFNFQNNLSGEYSERILMLYQRLGLQYESIRKISSMFFHKRVLGIRELANMYPSGAKNIIVRYIKDKNDIVRGEAQIAYVYLDEEASFDFLDKLKRPFSLWAQLNSLNFVKLHEKEVPSFDQWIHSPNNDIQDFSIRMINYFQQSENAPHLITLLDHENERTRLYAYQAINSLSYLEAKEIVKGKFEVENKRNKLEIIRLLANIGDDSDFVFFDNLLLTDDIEIRLAVCKTLHELGPSGRNHLEELKENSELDLEKYIEHIKDPRN
ncbi:HEAT repeat domain-containing protein [Sunxiuqinia sp. A32]|uniref:HEAT repeat domain-containing protein n=1 Tax=Sunxiuqinia sp. A32 TaxID=3461496 RepID=UPI004045399A